MRTIILSIIILFVCFSISAQVKTQGLTTSSSHLDSVNVMWNVNTRVRARPLVLTVDLTDTNYINKSNWGIQTDNDSMTDFVSYKWEAKEKALKLGFDYTNHVGNNLTSLFFEWPHHNISNSIWNPFIETDSLYGVFLDLTDPWSRFLTLTYKADGLDDSAYIRFDLTDANGRQSNFHSPRKKIYKDSNYHDITVSWVNDTNLNKESNVLGLVDGWSTSWFGIDNGRKNSISGKLLPNGLPSIGKGGIDTIPLDLTKICKFNIYINDSLKANSGIDKKFDIYIKKIVIGDALSIGTTDEFIFGWCGCEPWPWIFDTVLTKNISEKQVIKIYPNPVKDHITLETKATISQIEIINSIGLVVLQSKGQSQISVTNLAKGFYIVKATTNDYAVLTGGFVKE